MLRVRQICAFTAVSAAATIVHLGVVAGGVPSGLSPLVANGAGFVAGFFVSFAGHVRWSFPALGRPVVPAIRRFAVVSVLAFGCNEACYAGALEWTQIDYRVALLGVMMAVGLGTLWASQRWAFSAP